MTKTKILISTDSAAIHTGLAETCRLVFSDLLARYPDKYEIHQQGWFHVNPSEQVPWQIYNTNVKQTANGMELDPDDRYGQRSFEGLLAKIKPDIVWTNGDLWCFEHLLNSPNRNSFRLAAYYTIDGAPYFGGWLQPNKASEWGNKLLKADRLITLTEFGQKVLSTGCPELKDKKIDVIYHPMDMSRFRILDKDQRVNERKKLLSSQVPPNAFIMGWIGRNQFRKQNHKMWEVLHYMRYGDYIECNHCNRITVKEWDWCTQTSINGTYRYEAGYDYKQCWYCKSTDVVPGKPIDDFYLWQHMNAKDPGYNVSVQQRMWKVEDRVIVSGQDNTSRGIPPKVLAELISTWNCMIYLTGGEGFGVPAFESLMSGVPVVYANYSSHADFCKYGGLPVRVGEFVPEMVYGIHRSVCDTGDAVKQLLWAYRNQDELMNLGKNGRMFAMTKSVTAITDQWHNLFTEMMADPIPQQGNKALYAQVV